MSAMSDNATSLQLSVLIPVYNTGNLLEPSLSSLSAQTVERIEFVCIDDGSTDGSSAVLDAWAARDSRFRVLHLPNGGYGKAMNRALAEARGEWVGIVEPDDTIEPTMYSHLLELAARTSSPVIKGNYTIERKGSSRPAGKFSDIPPGTELPAETATDYILGSLAIWSGIYRRDWLIANGIRFSETPGAAFQDLGFAIRTWVAAAIPPRQIGITPQPSAFPLRRPTTTGKTTRFRAPENLIKGHGMPCMNWNYSLMSLKSYRLRPLPSAVFSCGASCTPCRQTTGYASAPG